MDRAAPILRSQGRLGLLAQLLVVRTWAGINTGQFSDALRAADEGSALATETGQPIWVAISQIGRAALLGLQGDDSAERLIAEASEPFSARRLSLLLAKAEFARGLIATTSGRHSEAVDHFSSMFLPDGAAFHEIVARAAAPYVIEAAVRAGRNEDALRLMEVVESLGRRTPAANAQVGAVYGRALLSGDSEAEDLYGKALSADAMSPFDRARVQMSYGAWLRRQRRVTDSRPHLRAARDAFDALGLEPWADKARVELRAAGERGSEPRLTPRRALTPQELQIAELAAAGLSNREIADRLFLSHRTVGAHLYRLFPKLGIVSRSELERALASLEPALTR